MNETRLTDRPAELSLHERLDELETGISELWAHLRLPAEITDADFDGIRSALVQLSGRVMRLEHGIKPEQAQRLATLYQEVWRVKSGEVWTVTELYAIRDSKLAAALKAIDPGRKPSDPGRKPSDLLKRAEGCPFGPKLLRVQWLGKGEQGARWRLQKTGEEDDGEGTCYAPSYDPHEERLARAQAWETAGVSVKGMRSRPVQPNAEDDNSAPPDPLDTELDTELRTGLRIHDWDHPAPRARQRDAKVSEVRVTDSDLKKMTRRQLEAGADRWLDKSAPTAGAFDTDDDFDTDDEGDDSE